MWQGMTGLGGAKLMHPNTSTACGLLADVRVPPMLQAATGGVEMMFAGVLLGAPGSGIKLHHHRDAVNVVVRGRKLWLMQAPLERADSRNATARVSAVREDLLAWARRVDGRTALEWLSAVGGDASALAPPGWREVRERLRRQGLVACEQRAGEMVYVPDGYAHAVLNLGDTGGGVHGLQRDEQRGLELVSAVSLQFDRNRWGCDACRAELRDLLLS